MSAQAAIRWIASTTAVVIAIGCTGNGTSHNGESDKNRIPGKTMPSATQPSSPEDIQITQNTAAYVADEKIAVFRIVEQDYETADGKTKRGMAAIVSWGNDRDQTAGVGSRLRIGGKFFDVVAVAGGSEDKSGHIVLRPVQVE